MLRPGGRGGGGDEGDGDGGGGEGDGGGEATRCTSETRTLVNFRRSTGTHLEVERFASNYNREAEAVSYSSGHVQRSLLVIL